MAKSLATQRNPANTFKEETKHNNTQHKQATATPGKHKAPGKLPAPNLLLPTTCPLPVAHTLFAHGCRVWPRLRAKTDLSQSRDQVQSWGFQTKRSIYQFFDNAARTKRLIRIKIRLTRRRS